MEFWKDIPYKTHTNMRKQIVIVCCVFMLNCTNKKEQILVDYLQSDTIELAQPRVNASSRMVDSSVIITADLKMEGVTIRYTENGEDPNETSKIYDNKLQVSKGGKYGFRAFHKDWKPSKTTNLSLFEKGILPTSFSWKTLASKTYPGLGPQTLVNNRLAELAFTDTQWLGFDTTAIASLKFGIKKQIKKLSISYLVDTKSWIFPPEKVLVIVNEKDSVSVSIPKLTEGIYKRLDTVEIPVSQEVRAIKINVVNSILPSWHPGANNKAWLFMDEWIFN